MSRSRRKPRPDDDILDRIDAAEAAKCSAPIYDDLIKRGVVPGRFLSPHNRRCYRVSRAALLAWLGEYGLPNGKGE